MVNYENWLDILNQATHNLGYWLMVLAIFIDIVSGLMLSFKEKKVDSSIAFRGWCKHVTVILMTTALEFISFAINQPQIATIGCVVIVVSGYMVSVRANLHLLGITMPPKLEEYLKREIERKIKK